MKKILYASLFLCLAAACNMNSNKLSDSAKADSTTVANKFGLQFESKEPVSADQLVEKVNAKRSFNGVVEGKITAVCKKAGCWANIETADGNKLKVLFRNADGSEFGIDKNSIGKKLIAHGVGYLDTTTVEMLRHYAADDGKSKEEIDKINSPEIVVGFTADGAQITE